MKLYFAACCWASSPGKETRGLGSMGECFLIF